MSIKLIANEPLDDGRDPLSLYVCTECKVSNFSPGICIGCGHNSLVERESEPPVGAMSGEPEREKVIETELCVHCGHAAALHVGLFCEHEALEMSHRKDTERLVKCRCEGYASAPASSDPPQSEEMFTTPEQAAEYIDASDDPVLADPVECEPVAWMVESLRVKNGHDWWTHASDDLVLTKAAAKQQEEHHRALGFKTRRTPLTRPSVEGEKPRDWRHDCGDWAMEGVACAKCNPTARAVSVEEGEGDDNPSANALDDICKVVGAPDWEYPGQVVRDVAKAIGLLDLVMTEHRPTKCEPHLPSCYVRPDPIAP